MEKKDKTLIRKEKQEALKAAQDNFLEAVKNLPELTGTEKQVNWAKDIRTAFIEKVKENSKEYFDFPRMKYYTLEFYVLAHILLKETEAKYFIDSRIRLKRYRMSLDFADDYIFDHLAVKDRDTYINTVLSAIKSGLSYKEIINKLEKGEL